MSTLLLCLLWACTDREPEAIEVADPHLVAEEIIDDVHAATMADAADPRMLWSRAHDRFGDLEPALRQRHGRHEVTALEYRFALVRANLGTARAQEHATRLGESLAALAAELPEPTS